MTRKTPPGQGERWAIGGYQHQYQAAAQLIYPALADGSLEWIGLADPQAGIVDDLLLGLTNGVVVGHQFKSSQHPGGFSIREASASGHDCSAAKLC